jgi:hypothetical protein
MTTDNKPAYLAYLTALAAPQPAPTDQPQPVPLSVTPRRDNYLARLTPLPDRLRIALEKFPVEMTANGLHMSQIWPLVTGVQRSKPRAFEVAGALRAIGWTRVRFYSDSGPSQTFWFGPEVNTAEAKAILKARKS